MADKHTKKSAPIVIDAARIADFVAGIADDNPRYQPGEDQVAPPLIVAASLIPGTGTMLTEVDLDLDLRRIVHGSIELAFHAPVRPRDAIACTGQFDGVARKSTGDEISFGYAVHNQNDALVCDGVTRYFVRDKTRGKGGRADPELPAGEPHFEVEQVVSEGQSLLYAKGSGDVFPIHTNPDFARMVGLPDVILHGMCTLAFSTRAVVSALLGGEAQRLRTLSVRFAKMVFHGDTLSTRIWRDDGGARFVTANQDGKLVLREGTASFD